MIIYDLFSETGKRRENQDYIRVVDHSEDGSYIFILCDGMGGHPMGGMASKIVATSIARDVESSSPKNENDYLEIMGHASRTLGTMADIYGGINMGTTMVMAHIDGNNLTVAHCGDSRCYVFAADKSLKYRTDDHNEGGCIGAPMTRAFISGYPEKAEPEVRSLKVDSGDCIFLCSDGVYSCIVPDILRDRMMDEKPLEDIMDTFKFLCERGSDDNYSAILIKIIP